MRYFCHVMYYADLEGTDFVIRQEIFGKMLSDQNATVREKFDRTQP